MEIIHFCRLYHDCDFKVHSLKPEKNVSINPKQFLELLLGHFSDGEEVIVAVTGAAAAEASAVFRTIWENVGDYADWGEGTATRRALTDLVRDVVRTHRGAGTTRQGMPELLGLDSISEGKSEHRAVAVINDRLHSLTLPIIPMVAKYHQADLEIAFEVPDKGIFCFKIEHSNQYELDDRLLTLNIEVGTRITVITRGEATRSRELNKAVQVILENLWQCDEWLRVHSADLEHAEKHAEMVEALLNFSERVSRSASPEFGYVQSPMISNLLSDHQVIVNAPTSRFSKKDVLSQLVASVTKIHELDFEVVFNRVAEVEASIPIIVSDGFAVAHAAMEKRPRIGMAFGVYPAGVVWTKEGETVQLVAMVLCAKDTYRTWRDYLRRISLLFANHPKLQAQLVHASDQREFKKILRTAELSVIDQLLGKPPNPFA